jgi:motility quorum-sensing regulator/GCU-specific mRNA interferase toxin
MEKHTPHTKLDLVRKLIKDRKVKVTRSAMVGASELGFGFDEMLEVVTMLMPSDFHKSMTTHSDHTIWQDVYRPTTKAGAVYLKLTVIDDVLIVSFKEL